MDVSCVVQLFFYFHSDDLHKRLVEEYPHVLQHEMLCTFVDFAISKYKTKLAGKNLRLSKCDVYDDFARPTYNSEQFKWKLLVCTEHGYQFLTQTIVNFYHAAFIFTKVLKMDDKMCEELILRALRNDNVNFFKYIHITVKSFVELNLKEFCKLWTHENELIKRSLFFESITRGNYNLV